MGLLAERERRTGMSAPPEAGTPNPALREKASTGHPYEAEAASPSRARAMTSRWIWLVPSKIWPTFTSRM
jgi:hypothetical protein